MYRNHQCLVFEMLSLNLYELLKNTYFSGVSLNLVRKFAKQVLRSLAFLRRRDVDVIHCDLKPENILLRHPKKSAIKVIDFGSSCRSNKRMYSYIQSRFYRSPEVILGLTYSTAIDMWSLGCILAEMHTGEPLFSGADDFDQMKKIVSCLGMIPTEMLERSNVKQRFFLKVGGAWKLRREKEGTPKGNETQEIGDVDPIGTLSKSVVAGRLQKKKFPQSEAYNSAENHRLFIDLVSKMLVYSPEHRLDPLDALHHPFLQMPED
jgi:dual specificity tyrosine-phosphorylation-regulated kinase 1